MLEPKKSKSEQWAKIICSSLEKHECWSIFWSHKKKPDNIDLAVKTVKELMPGIETKEFPNKIKFYKK